MKPHSSNLSEFEIVLKDMEEKSFPSTKPATTVQLATSFLSLLSIVLLLTSVLKSDFTTRPSLTARTSHDTHVRPQSPPQTPALTCGTTPTSALAANCSFDPLSFSWLPAPCYDSELIASFLALKDWAWYLHPSPSTHNLTHAVTNRYPTPVPYATVLSGTHHHMYVSREFHLYHCTYMWRKMHRAWARGGPMDSYVGNYSHTGHCEGVLTTLDGGRKGELGVVDVRISRKFVDCGGEWAEKGKGRELYGEMR